MLEMLGGLLDPWMLVRLAVPALQIVFSAPPCPGSPDGFPEDMVYYGYSAVRDALWGHPCP